MGKTTGRQRNQQPKDDPKPEAAAPAKGKGKGDELEWMDVEQDSLTGGVASAYGAYKKARELAGEKRDAFQDEFTKNARASGDLEEDKGFVFGYRFGKLSVALVPREDSERKGPKEKKTFRLGGGKK